MLRSPLAVGVGHTLTGSMRCEANECRGYNIHMTLTNANTGVTHTNTVVTQCALHHFQYTTQQSVNWAGYGAQAAQQAQPQPQAGAYTANGSAASVE